MKLPFKKEEFLGNIRSGNKRENNSPRNLNYFDVHIDNYTSEYSIELFKSIYKDITNTLKIKPIMNIIVTNEIYSKNIKCKGLPGNSASRIIGKEEKKDVLCNPDACKYFINEECTRVGRLYFRLVGIEDKGIWCYSTRSRGIDFIEKYLKLMQEQGSDITNNYFQLTLREKYGQSGKVYVPDIKLIKKEIELQQNCYIENKENQINKKINQTKNLYKYMERTIREFNSQKIPKLTFVSLDGKKNIFYIAKTSKKDILYLDIGTEIEILKVYKNNQNKMFLMDYNVIKEVKRKEDMNQKKAV